MPYKIEKRGDEWCVFKEGEDGDPLGCHESEADAQAQVDALYANEDEDAKEASFSIAAESGGYITHKQPIAFVHGADRIPAKDVKHASLTTDGITFNIEGAADTSLMTRLKEVLREYFSDTPQASGFKVFGNHWFARYSNNFKDRDEEFFTEQAHDDYIARVKSGDVPYPELWVEHIPGTRIGQASFVGRIGHFVVAAGAFDDGVLGQKAKTYYARHKPKGVSHGFSFNPARKDGSIYHQYDTFEISPLVRKTPANAWTTFDGVKAMKLTEQDIAQLEAMFGKDVVEKEILADTEKVSKALEEIGLAYKSEVDASETRVTKTVTEQAEAGLKTFLLSIISDTAEIAEYAASAAKAQKAHEQATQQAFDAYKTATDAKLAAQDKQLAEMREQLNLRPRSASKDAATEVDDEKLGDEFKKQFVQTHPFFGTEITTVGD